MTIPSHVCACVCAGVQARTESESSFREREQLTILEHLVDQLRQVEPSPARWYEELGRRDLKLGVFGRQADRDLALVGAVRSEPSSGRARDRLTNVSSDRHASRVVRARERGGGREEEQETKRKQSKAKVELGCFPENGTAPLSADLAHMIR